MFTERIYNLWKIERGLVGVVESLEDIYVFFSNDDEMDLLLSFAETQK